MAFIIFPYLKVLLVSMEIYIKQDNNNQSVVITRIILTFLKLISLS